MTYKSKTKEYDIWKQMKRRCSQQTDPSWKWYGGRGIEVCERWQVFENFIEDMGSRPSHRHSLDRIDPSGNYEPENVRWATWDVQAKNKNKRKQNERDYLKIKKRTNRQLAGWFMLGRLRRLPRIYNLEI